MEVDSMVVDDSMLGSERLAVELHRRCLSHVYKYDCFRGVQERAILEWSVRGRDTIVVWRTGGGKSVLFAVPALFHHTSTTVVILPLIALIEDVYQQLLQRHIMGVYFHHQMTADRIRCAPRFLFFLRFPVCSSPVLQECCQYAAEASHTGEVCARYP